MGNPTRRTEWLDRIPRAHMSLFSLWDEKRGQRPFPARSDFDFTDLMPWLGNLHLVAFTDTSIRFLVYGTKIARINGRDWTGKEVTPSDYPQFETLIGYYLDTRDARWPLAHLRPALNKERTQFWSRLFLPLGEDDRTVDKMLVHALVYDKAPEL